MTMDDDSEREVEKYRQSDGEGIALVYTNSKGMGGCGRDIMAETMSPRGDGKSYAR